MVDCSLEIFLSPYSNCISFSLHHKTTCGFHSVQRWWTNNYWLFWVTLNVEASTFPKKWRVLYCLGPLSLNDGCQMLECAMFRSYCRSLGLFPSTITRRKKWKEKSGFIRCAIINTQNLKLVMRVIQIKLQGMHVYLSSTEWNYSVEREREKKKQTRLINGDSCVQESQLVGLNHYLAGAHLTFSFCLKKKKKENTELVSDQKLCCSSACSAVRGCFKV